MSWASIANNKCVTVDDVNSGISTGYCYVIGSAPSKPGNQAITKSELQSWVATTSVSGLSNQLVTKNGIIFDYYSFAINIYSIFHGFYYEGYLDSAEACSQTPATAITLYSTSPTLGIGSVLFVYAFGGYYPFTLDDYSYPWIYDTTNLTALEISGNTIITSQTCISPTATLSFIEYVGGDTITNGYFTFNLSNPLPSNITIGFGVTTYSDFSCGIIEGGDTIYPPETIVAGVSGSFYIPGATGTCTASYISNNNIVVNGNPMYSGDTIVIGGTTLTIYIPTPTCTVMLCVA